MQTRVVFILGRVSYHNTCIHLLYCHGIPATACATVVVDRNQVKGIAVENSTFEVGGIRSRFEILELFPEKKRYTLRE